VQENTSPSKIDQLLAQVPEKSGSRAVEALDPETRGILEAFTSWLEDVDGKSPATAKAYKSYVATAIAKMESGETWDDMTTDVRSGVNAFVRYTETLKDEIEALEDETEDDVERPSEDRPYDA
jgi:hypothetical protein